MPINFSFKESQIELEDSLWQLFSEPEELTLLNIDLVSRRPYAFQNEKGSPLTYWIDISKEIVKERR